MKEEEKHIGYNFEYCFRSVFFILKYCINVKVNIHSFGIPLLISPTQIVCYMDLMFIKLHTVNINRENNWKFYMLSIYLKNLF